MMVTPTNKARTFPKPWYVAEQGKSFRVLDATNFPVCHIYYDGDATNWHPYLPNREQAADLARKIALLPELLDGISPGEPSA